MATTTTAPRTHRPVDAWTLNAMREAKAERDADPAGCVAPEFEALLDQVLADAEAAHATGHIDPATPVADQPQTRPAGNGNSTGRGGRNDASDKQINFIVSLSRQLGIPVEQPRDKAHASLIIDRLVKATKAAPAAARPATDSQRSYLADLLASRSVEGVEVPDLDVVTFDRASALIDQLRSAPRAAVSAHGIREGRYAYQATPDHAVFYRVTRTGRIHVVAGPAEHPYNGKLNEALEWIKTNQRDAAALFGQLLGTCGRCGLHLTDDDSRARGLGPVCAGKEW